MIIQRKAIRWHWIVYKCILLLIVFDQSAVCADDTSYLQQLQRAWSRALGGALGLASIVLKTANPPTAVRKKKDE